MLKKRLLVGCIVAAVATGILVGNTVLGPAFAKSVASQAPRQSDLQTADDDVADTAFNTPDIEEADEASVPQMETVISSEEAMAIAEAANPSTTAVDVELDSENSILVYSVELSNGLEAKVDAGSGVILSTGQNDADGEDSDQDGVSEHEGQANEEVADGPDVEEEAEDSLPQEVAIISSDEAKAIAEAANPGSTALEVELDNEDGGPVYSIELSNGLEVEVDATTGAILDTEQENTDTEDND